MITLNQQQAAIRQQISKSKMEIVFLGGHGGHVTYDGKGGAMTKKGGPMDKIFAFRNDDQFDLTQGFDITYGSIYFSTGNLDGDVKKIDENHFEFSFKGNDSNNAVEVRGGIEALGLPNDTILFSGNVEPSKMILKQLKNTTSLPYVAFHSRFEINTKLLSAFGLKKGEARVAYAGWTKNGRFIDNISNISKKGISFDTQQHLGYLRIF
jgi:hypothetical protein